MRGQGTNRRRIDRKNAANFVACYFADVICGNPRVSIAFLQPLDDTQRHRHADIRANQRFLELVPVDRFAGESVDDVLEKFHAKRLAEVENTERRTSNAERSTGSLRAARGCL